MTETLSDRVAALEQALERIPQIAAAMQAVRREREPAPPPPPPKYPQPEAVELGRVDGEGIDGWQLRLLKSWENSMWTLRGIWDDLRANGAAAGFEARSAAESHLRQAADIAAVLLGERRLPKNATAEDAVLGAVLDDAGGVWDDVWWWLRQMQQQRGEVSGDYHLPPQRPAPPDLAWYERHALEAPPNARRVVTFGTMTTTTEGPAPKPSRWDV